MKKELDDVTSFCELFDRFTYSELKSKCSGVPVFGDPDWTQFTELDKKLAQMREDKTYQAIYLNYRDKLRREKADIEDDLDYVETMYKRIWPLTTKWDLKWD